MEFNKIKQISSFGGNYKKNELLQKCRCGCEDNFFNFKYNYSPDSWQNKIKKKYSNNTYDGHSSVISLGKYSINNKNNSGIWKNRSYYKIKSLEYKSELNKKKNIGFYYSKYSKSKKKKSPNDKSRIKFALN